LRLIFLDALLFSFSLFGSFAGSLGLLVVVDATGFSLLSINTSKFSILAKLFSLRDSFTKVVL